MKERYDIETLITNTKNGDLCFSGSAYGIAEVIANMDFFYFLYMFDFFPRSFNRLNEESGYKTLLHDLNLCDSDAIVTVGQVCEAIVNKYEGVDDGIDYGLNKVIRGFLDPYLVFVSKKKFLLEDEYDEKNN